MNCILAEQVAIRNHDTVALNQQQSRHVTNLLKKGPGDSILAGIIDGPIGMCAIIGIDDGRVFIEAPRGRIPPRPPIHLVLAMPRPKVMKRLWSPIASLGVGTITIIGAEKVEPYYFDSHALDEKLFRARLIEGLEQARDTRLPEVSIFKSFDWFAKRCASGLVDDAVRVVCHPGAERGMWEAVCDHPSNEVVAAIGPEGGWTEHELRTLENLGFVPAGLHTRALRTDVAVISVLTLLHEGLA